MQEALAVVRPQSRAHTQHDLPIVLKNLDHFACCLRGAVTEQGHEKGDLRRRREKGREEEKEGERKRERERGRKEKTHTHTDIRGVRSREINNNNKDTTLPEQGHEKVEKVGI